MSPQPLLARRFPLNLVGVVLVVSCLLGAATSLEPVASAAVAHRPSAPPKQSTATTIATLVNSTPDLSGPNGRTIGTVPATWHGYPSALPVISDSGKFLHVRLATRPNGSTAWIAKSAPRLSTSLYRIVIDLKTTHLLLYKNDLLEMSAAAGVGTKTDPTPLGQFFVTFFVPAPGTYWGGEIIGTSAHSDVIQDWENTGDAMIGIHGPVGQASLIGTTGGYISHGCIRLDDDTLAKLFPVPAGTPIDIVD